MKRGALLATLLAAPLAACATTDAPPATAEGSAPSPAEIVAARKAAFMLSAATFGGMKPVVEQGGDVKPLAFPARGLARWAEALPTMFPATTSGVASRAKAELWSNHDDFKAKAASFQAATAALAESASAGDVAGFKVRYAAVDAACSACHELYRAPPPPR